MYTEIRDSILDGHLVFFEPSTFIGKLIPMITGGKVSHCGIAVWMRDGRDVHRLMLLEGFWGGCRLVNMSSYAHRKFVALDVGLVWNSVEDYALDKTGVVHYSATDFVWIWLRERLAGIGLRSLAKLVPNAPGEVCSEVVADILIKSGQFHWITERLVSPSALLRSVQGYIKTQVRN